MDCGIGESGCRERVAAEKEENQSGTLEFIDNAKEFTDDSMNLEELMPTGMGGRLDASGMVLGGVDGNIDVVYLWSSREFDILVNGGIQGGPVAQVGASTGAIIYFNVDEMKTLTEGSSPFVGGSYILEGEFTSLQNPDGSQAGSIYIGVGPNSPSEGLPVYGGSGKTYMTLSETLDKVRSYCTKIEGAIWDHTTGGYYGSYPGR